MDKLYFEHKDLDGPLGIVQATVTAHFDDKVGVLVLDLTYGYKWLGEGAQNTIRALESFESRFKAIRRTIEQTDCWWSEVPAWITNDAALREA